MRTAKSRWDVERAAAWLRKLTWGASGEDGATPQGNDGVGAAVPGAGGLPQQVRDGEHRALEQEQEREREQEVQRQGQEQEQDQNQNQKQEQEQEQEQDGSDEIEIAAWPALVAPVYD